MTDSKTEQENKPLPAVTKELAQKKPKKNKSKTSLLTKIKAQLGGLETLQNLFSGEEKNFFIENFAMLLTSGMNVVLGLEALEKEVRSTKMKEKIKSAREDIDGGSPIWKAFKQMDIFPEYAISLVRVGEESGKLSENLLVVASQMQKDRMFKTKVRSAMLYPAIVMSLTIFIGIAVAWFILPKLATVFTQLDVELPFVTRILIGFGEFIGEYGVIAVPIGVVILVLIGYILFSYKKTKHIGDEIMARFPGIKKLVKEVQIARLGFVLGNLLNAGLPVVRALESLVEATTSRKYRQFYSHLRVGVEEGKSFQKSFSEYKETNKLIPIPIQQMIIAAEQSGRLPDSLEKIGKDYEAKTEITTKNLVVVLEPIMLVVVWLGVVAVAMAVILPIYSLIGGFNRDRGITTSSNPQPVETDVTETEPDEKVEEVPEDKKGETDEETQDQENQEADEETPEKERPEEEPAEETLPKLEVQPTGVGYLNVRSQPTTASNIVTRVDPGDVYEYTDFVSGWYKIILDDGSRGWVSGQYVALL